jgi:hypothetical protein
MQDIEQQVIVCDINVDGILGQDFILKHVKSCDMDTLQLDLTSVCSASLAESKIGYVG